MADTRVMTRIDKITEYHTCDCGQEFELTKNQRSKKRRLGTSPKCSKACVSTYVYRRGRPRTIGPKVSERTDRSPFPIGPRSHVRLIICRSCGRERVSRRANGRCVPCQAEARKVFKKAQKKDRKKYKRTRIADRDGWTCYLCEEPIDQTITNPSHNGYLNIDHIDPLVRGGADKSSNMAATHHSCNMAKGTQTLEQYRQSTPPN